jgi:hypothetical protein
MTAWETKVPQVRFMVFGLKASALRIARFAAASTTHSKFSCPTELISASGAGLQKSIA